MSEWQPIELYEGHGPVLVSKKPTKHLRFTATTAFKDVTGVWRVFRSRCGMDEMPWEPDFFMPLPEPPSDEPFT